MIRMMTAAVVLCLVVVFVCWAGNRLETHACALLEELDAARDHAALADWEAVSENLNAMEESWAEIQPFARIVLEQCVVRDTEEAVARLSAAADVRDTTGFLTEAASLEACFNGLAQDEELSWNTLL